MIDPADAIALLRLPAAALLLLWAWWDGRKK